METGLYTLFLAILNIFVLNLLQYNDIRIGGG